VTDVVIATLDHNIGPAEVLCVTSQYYCDVIIRTSFPIIATAADKQPRQPDTSVGSLRRGGRGGEGRRKGREGNTAWGQSRGWEGAGQGSVSGEERKVIKKEKEGQYEG